MAATTDAFRAWLDLLGGERVLQAPPVLDAYAASTSGWSTRPLAVLKAGSTEEVVAIVRIAGEAGLPLYPISTGHNWGYGDACAVRDGQVILDLSEMRRIREVDAGLAYAVVEPGVTQRQLSAFLLEQGLPLWMDCTGAGPDTSLVGNILERGFGHSPYGNRFQHISGMEVVLANGAVLHTGFGHFAGAVNQRVFSYGLGPALDGIFTQSNFGVVTSLGLWLMPQSDAINHLLCQVHSHAAVADVVDALRPLRLDGTLRSVLHIGNDLRVLSGGMTFPHAQAGGASTLPPALKRQLCGQAGIAPWTVSGALYGSRAQLALARRSVRRALHGLPVTVRVLDERLLAIASALARLLGGSAAGQRLRNQAALGQSLFDMNRGIPNGRFLAGAYWRRRGGLPPGFPEGANPARDNCGIMWVSPVLPMRGVDMLRVYGLAEAIFRKHQFDLFATFSMVTERALGGVLTIAYDKEDAGEAQRAAACYHELFDAVCAAGYIPYRVGLQSMAALDDGVDPYWRTVARIKEALDPQHIIAPGRYSARQG